MRTASYLLWIAISLVGAAACAKKKDAAPPPESGASSASGGDASATAAKPDEAAVADAAKPTKPDEAAAAKPEEQPVLVASNGPVPSKPAPATPSKVAAMKPGFAKAYASFAELAAAELGLPVDEIQAGPGREDIKMEHTLGKAWAFTAVQKNVQGPRQIRGWATADGTAISPKQNLGALLKEAGVWGKKAPKADAIAKAIAWGLGANYTINLDPWPALTVDKKGEGTLVFAVDGREAGPGGAGGGPVTKQLATVALTADHAATLTLAKP
jgi:hypothetical protein